MTLLLKSGADVNIRTRNDAIALDLAHGNGRPDAARVLSEWMGVGSCQSPTDVTRSSTASQDPPPRVTQPPIGRGIGANGTSLHIASGAGDGAELLIQCGTDVNLNIDAHASSSYANSGTRDGSTHLNLMHQLVCCASHSALSRLHRIQSLCLSAPSSSTDRCFSMEHSRIS